MSLLTIILPNVFWILGLALILSTVSYLHWLTRLGKKDINDYLKNPLFQRLFWTGLMLVSLSLWLLAINWWERVVWSIFFFLFLLYTWRTKV